MTVPPYCREHDTHHTYYGEHGDMRRAALAAERDAARRERAEQIAADVLAAQPLGHGLRGSLAPRILEALTVAALQALTEKENAQ